MVFPVVPDSSNYRVWFFIWVSGHFLCKITGYSRESVFEIGQRFTFSFKQIGVVEILQHCTAPGVFHCLPHIVICFDCIITALVNQEKMVAPRNREQIFSKLLKICVVRISAPRY